MKKLFFILTFSIFGISASAQYTKLLDFNDTNGRYPFGSLYYDGIYLYGMTEYGGIKDTGTIFKIKPDGSGYVKLLDFTGSVNGSRPHGSLISDGAFLYGTTMNGGINNLGTIFKIKPDGSGYAKLLDFANVTNGSNPNGSLIFDGSFLYGVTGYGGIKDSGTIYKIKPDGSNYLKIFDFAGDTNGTVPDGSLFYDGTFLYGITTPALKLEVQGSISLYDGAPGNGNNGDNSLFFGREQLNATTYGEWGIQYATATQLGSSVGGLNFWKPYGSHGSFGNNFLFLADNGNVGIGTASPNNNLDISGKTVIGTTYAGNNTISAPTDGLLVQGHVLIGQTSQANTGYLLDVAGPIRANEVDVNTTGADFVFEQDYQLKSISELEQYINKNKHLPEIPAANEVQKNGVELGKMNTLLLQKIEELTLYIIELQKEVNILKSKSH